MDLRKCVTPRWWRRDICATQERKQQRSFTLRVDFWALLNGTQAVVCNNIWEIYQKGNWWPVRRINPYERKTFKIHHRRLLLLHFGGFAPVRSARSIDKSLTTPRTQKVIDSLTPSRRKSDFFLKLNLASEHYWFWLSAWWSIAPDRLFLISVSRSYGPGVLIFSPLFALAERKAKANTM